MVVESNNPKRDSVAQPGEHHLDRVGVAGSNPVGITSPYISRVYAMFSSFKNMVVADKPKNEI